MRILFICTGNTCRSPMAQAIIGHISNHGHTCASAGLAAYPGRPASEYAMDALGEIGIDFVHTSRQINERDQNNYDLFFAMTKAHKTALINLGFDPEEIITPVQDVTDPYGGTLDHYRAVRDQIKTEMEHLLNFLSDENDIP